MIWRPVFINNPRTALVVGTGAIIPTSNLAALGEDIVSEDVTTKLQQFNIS
jgi:hypothetical protein